MADILDIVDLGSVQAAVGVGDSQTGRLASYITTVSRHIDDLCGPVVIRAIASEAHHGGTCDVLLKHRPVAAISAITESGLAVTDYHLDTESGLVERMAPGAVYVGWYWRVGRWNVSVSYTAGRYATTAVVDELFKRAAAITVQYLWQCEEGGGGTATYGAYEGETVALPGSAFVIPKSAYMLLRPYVQSRLGIA